MWLATTIYTATRTSHDFYEGIVSFSCLYLIHNYPGVGQPAGNSNLNLLALQVVFGLFYALYATNIYEVKINKLFACKLFDSRSERCLHYTTSSPKDYSRSSIFTEWIIIWLIFKLHKLDTSHPDHLRKFTSCK